MAPAQQHILDELRLREPIFHHEQLGSGHEVFEAMTDESFWEVGASGRCYTREDVIATLVERYSAPHEDVWRADDFQCLEIAPENYLLTYTLIQNGDRKTRRSTIWRRAAGDWKIVYHQGTIVADDE